MNIKRAMESTDFMGSMPFFLTVIVVTYSQSRAPTGFPMAAPSTFPVVTTA